MKGVPAGYQHNWKYKVKAYKSRKKYNKEDFTEVQSKSRTRKTKSYGSFKRGTKIIWKLKGKFKTKRVRGGFLTTTTMIKRKVKVKPKGRRWG